MPGVNRHSGEESISTLPHHEGVRGESISQKTELCSHESVSNMVFITDEYSSPGSNISALKNWELFLMAVSLWFLLLAPRAAAQDCCLLHKGFILEQQQDNN